MELSQHPAAFTMRVNVEVDKALGNAGTFLNCALRHSPNDSNIYSKCSSYYTTSLLGKMLFLTYTYFVITFIIGQQS